MMRALPSYLWKRLLAALCGAAALAASANEARLAPSQALQCLTPAGAGRAPPYPAEAFERQFGGLVEVELRFAHPRRQPQVTVVRGEDLHALLVNAVIDHVRTFRVPCMASGDSVRLRQSFRFLPHDGRAVVQWSETQDVADGERAQRLACLVQPSDPPTYPANAAHRLVQGTVPLRLRFSTPAAPPTVQLLDDTPHRWLVEAAMAHTRQMRVPCLGDEALELDIFFVFRHVELETLVVRDMPLVQYLRLLRGIREQQVYFNFNEMQCPFELRIEQQHPARDHRIGQLDGPVPERSFFISWLARQPLDVTPQYRNALIGRTSIVRVPCGVLALGNRSAGAGSR